MKLFVVHFVEPVPVWKRVGNSAEWTGQTGELCSRN